MVPGLARGQSPHHRQVPRFTERSLERQQRVETGMGSLSTAGATTTARTVAREVELGRNPALQQNTNIDDSMEGVRRHEPPTPRHVQIAGQQRTPAYGTSGSPSSAPSARAHQGSPSTPSAARIHQVVS